MTRLFVASFLVTCLPACGPPVKEPVPKNMAAPPIDAGTNLGPVKETVPPK